LFGAGVCCLRNGDGNEREDAGEEGGERIEFFFLFFSFLFCSQGQGGGEGRAGAVS
jgi:hypothetical protein